MKTYSFLIENLKCRGCENTIRKEIAKFPSVNKVTVNLALSQITIDLEEVAELELIKDRLAKIGYPEVGKNSFVTAAKSYISCAIGRMDAL
ncbi:MAG: heavy-metal-associated domain-containing protein [Bacteroidales bacterium]|nr:heavy-metal-associated domain-containing protein [Bacteroidales bacterium]